MINGIAVDSAIKEYSKEFNGRKYIHPISSVDTEIIKALVSVLSKTTGSSWPLRIFGEYKYLPDNEILNKILDFSNTVPDFMQESNEPGQYFDFNNIEEERVVKRFIIRMSKVVSGEQFGILLNETETDITNKPTYANAVIRYESEEERDEDFRNLKLELDK